MSTAVEAAQGRGITHEAGLGAGITALEILGPPDAPVVVALGGISATRRVADWWGTIARPGGAVDLGRFRVAGVDWLDGGDRGDGFPARSVSTYEQADAIAGALDAAGVDRVRAMVGASYGGMVALAFAERHPDRLEQLIVISAPARAHPMAVAVRSIQQRIVRLALESGRAADGLALARQLAVTTYRSPEEFGERFDAESVRSYLRHQGDKFARRFTTARFLALSRSVDEHRIDPARIPTPAVLIAARADAIVPLEQMQELADTLAGPTVLRCTMTSTGHDAFLAEPHACGAVIRSTLANPLT